MLTSAFIKAEALRLGADLCGIGDIRLYEGCDPRRDPKSILPNAACVIGFGFRVPKGLYAAMENRTQYMNYVSLGVKYIDEDLSETFLLQMSRILENDGWDACLQRNVSNLKVKGDKTQNPEVRDTYELSLASAVRPGKPAPEVILDWAQSARICGLGSVSPRGKVLTEKFGPFVRFVYLITDCPLEPDEPYAGQLCDGCGECEKACPGNAIDASGTDSWQCSVYYRGAGRSNPYVTEDFLRGEPEREAILDGKVRFDAESARRIYPKLDFLPSRATGYVPCLCGKACDVACMRHLERSGKLK